MGHSQLEAKFLQAWNLLAPVWMPEPEREYRFHATRRWRFDFAWPEQMVAAEIDGGTWKQGRHSRGNGYRNDCEKLNEAALCGWRVLRFTSGMLRDPQACIDKVVEALNANP